ncbi:MAG: hypothetical protein ACK5VW_06555 [Holosporales bacterium]
MTKTSMLKKIHDLNQKIEKLKNEQQKAQRRFAEGLVQLIGQQNGFQLDMNIIFGIIIDGINKAQSDSKQAKAWEDMGLKFRSKRTSRTAGDKTQSSQAA